MARIHLARVVGDEGFSRIVAAKRINPELACEPEFAAMFLDEARVASRVRHRNVVAVLDVVTLDDELVIVQELVQGAPLHKVFVRAGQSSLRIPAAIATAIAAQVLAGLHAAHETLDELGKPLGIIHRDVSPQNIMIANDGVVRLLDFGVAKATALAAAHVTRAGMFKGKIPYSSPEQLLGKPTRQTDVFALGIVLWELLAGRRMHGGLADVEIYKRVLDEPAPPITKVLAKLHRDGRIDDAEWQRIVALEPIIARALARDLAERYPTADAMEHALLAVVTPAPAAELAAWLRELAPDILQATEQLIAEEEASWRLARGSGCGPVVKRQDLMPPRPRPPSSLGTEPAKPSALVVAKHTRELAILAERQRRTHGILIEVLAVAAVLLFWLASTGRHTHSAAAAAAPPPAAVRLATRPAAPPPPPGPVTSPAPGPSAPASATPTTPSRQHARLPARRNLVRRRVVAPAKEAVSCATPFYYEGTKKVFKPNCI